MAKNKFDELLRGLGNGIADVREKLVDEAYFGRPAGGELTVEHSVAAAPSFEDYAREAARSEKHEEPAHQPDMER